MQKNSCELKIVVKGRPIAEYHHDGETFVEGRAGSEYEIHVTNHNAFRIEAVITVDGLSVTDGQPAGEASTGYVVHAHSTLVLPGWKVDNATAARFAFSGKKTSYAAQSTGSSANNGVIGVMAFREKPRFNYATAQNPLAGLHGYGASILRNACASSPPGSGGGDMFSASAAVANTASTISYNAACSTTAGSPTRGLSAPAAVTPQSLGTEFGKATEFATSTVAFERGPMQAVLILYYDDVRGLKARGVVIKQPPSVAPLPQAFPAMGCRPPLGWTGV